MASMWNVKRVVTRDSVNVDSVLAVDWTVDDPGIKDIVADAIGVHIHTNFNSTFVPWANVRYTKGWGSNG